MGVNLFVLSLLLGLLPQAAHAQCSLCGEKLVRFHLNVPANCAVRLNYGDQSQTFSATSLPKAAEGYIRINMNSGGRR